MRQIPVVHRVILCICGHQQFSHQDARFNAGDPEFTNARCKDCPIGRCKRFWPAV